MSCTFTYIHPKSGIVQHKLKQVSWSVINGVMKLSATDDRDRMLQITTNCLFVLRHEEETTGLPLVDSEENS